ncbi:thioredoxin domain-containing protein [Lentzea sp. NPDC059081]|uniref:thioredoxin domain-containing protein n=1 Tax=Lentzea sp. NPDC059081 TaxID=3346719 RepID=UPI00369F4258
MANRLADATSPYLLQHAENPVDWWPWTEEAFAEARRRNVPVLLSIGYAACHWCHVMAHESFEDVSIAEFLNENFVSVKVDREERPDVDAVYMEVTQAMTGHGGWPMTVFLTPDARPFHAGTYYPPAPRPGMPSFKQIIEAVHATWTTRPDEILESASVVVEEISRHAAPLPPSVVDSDALAGAVVSLLGEFDRRHGGFGGAPKFPPSMVAEFLLRHHERTGSVEAISMATTTADAMANGGMYDQLGGGFARYSVDAAWVVPHFEKMLYDNALLLRFYTHLTRVTGSERYARVARDTAAFLLRDLRAGDGFAASLDADTNGVEGLTYVWSFDELGDAAAAFGVTGEPNFEGGKSTLGFVSEPGEDVRAALLARRSERPQPGRDDKVIAAWNGMAIAALAEAGAFFGEPAWVTAAVEAASLLASVHLVEGRLLRTSRGGVAGPSFGVLEDYGCLADGLLALHQVTGSIRWLDLACGLLDTALVRFAVPETPGAYYDTADDAEALVRRPADSTDNASPSGASSLASALVTASLLVGADRSSRYLDAASAAVTRAGLLAARAPRFAGHWLTVAETLVAGPLQVAVVGAGDDPRRASLWAAAVAHVPGGGVVVAGEPSSVPLLEERPLLDEAPAAYVCRGYVCEMPVASVDALVTSLTANTL